MKKTIIIIFGLLLTVSLSAQDIQGFVAQQLKTYPKSRLLDLYKSSFQDYMGAEHLVSDRESVKAYLDEELQSVSQNDLLSWYFEPCGVDGRYVRVSLRAVKEKMISEDLLLDSFVRSANSENRPSVEVWRDRWHMIIGTIDRMNLNIPNYQEDRAFIDSILSVGKYAISHSPEYREAYNPHYRIVERGIFERELKPLIKPRSQTPLKRVYNEEINPFEQIDQAVQKAQSEGTQNTLSTPTSPSKHPFLRCNSVASSIALTTSPEGNRQLRIVDYKTSSKTQSANSIEVLFDKQKNSRPYHILQTFYYADIYTRLHPDAPIAPSMMYVKKARTTNTKTANNVVALGTSKDNTPITNFTTQCRDEFHQRLTDTIDEIFNPAVPFSPNLSSDSCKYCDFAQFCGQSSKKE